MTREKGYRHLEGVAERLVAEALGTESAGAREHLRRAIPILEQVDARNDLAKALVTESACRLAARDPSAARDTLRRALEIFESLGTLDRPCLVASCQAGLRETLDPGDGSAGAA